MAAGSWQCLWGRAAPCRRPRDRPHTAAGGLAARVLRPTHSCRRDAESRIRGTVAPPAAARSKRARNVEIEGAGRLPRDPPPTFQGRLLVKRWLEGVAIRKAARSGPVTDPLRVLVVDADPLSGAALARAVDMDRDMAVVGQCRDLRRVGSDAARCSPDLVAVRLSIEDERCR